MALPKPPPPRSLADALDLNRYEELVRHADILANIWTAFKLAAERGDNACIRYHWEQIRAYSKAVNTLVRALGRDEATDG